MDVTLVNPPYTFWKPEAEPLAELLGHHPPLGPLSLAAYARRHVDGLALRIVDAPASGLSVEETARRVVEGRPDVVGITMTTTVARNAEAIALAVRAALPDASIVVGGPHVSGAGPAALGAANAFDVAVVGEGEETFRELLEARRAGRPFEGIRGTLRRGADGAVVATPRRDYVADLDELPMPAFDLLEDFPRAYQPNVFFSPGGPAASISTSRGCPFRCTFCDQSTFGHRYRAMSAEAVVATVRTLQADYRIRYLIFVDDTFTLNRQRVLDICEGLAELRPRLAWSCDANVMTVDPTMLQAMGRAGCWSVSYGIESGSARLLESLHKDIELDRARQAVRATRDAGIRVKGLFILGTPEESHETIEQTRALIRELPLSTLNLSKFTPYPGSELHDQVKGRLTEDCERLNGMNFVLPSHHLSVEELEREYDLTVRHFYKTTRVFLRHLAILLGRWQNVCRLLSAAPRLIRARRRRRTEPVAQASSL